MTVAAPPESVLVVLERVGVPKPTSILQLSRPTRGYPRSAKRGIYVAAGAPVTLAVPAAYRRTYALAGGPRSVDRGAKVVRVEPCPADPDVGGGPWSGRPFVYYVKKPACVPLVVMADGRSATVKVGLGRTCT